MSNQLACLAQMVCPECGGNKMITDVTVRLRRRVCDNCTGTGLRFPELSRECECGCHYSDQLWHTTLDRCDEHCTGRVPIEHDVEWDAVIKSFFTIGWFGELVQDLLDPDTTSEEKAKRLAINTLHQLAGEESQDGCICNKVS